MHPIRWLTAIVLAAGTLPAPATAATYKVDPGHTSVTFLVRHLLTNVEGRFRTFEGTIVFDPAEPEKTVVKGTIDVASIDTNVEKRDEHLRSPDFFDVAKYPKIEFVSTGVSDVDRETNTGKLHGNLTIHGVTKPVVLDAQFLGAATDPWGNKKGGFTATTTINRKDFGLTWNKSLETGGLLVGDEVTIRLNVEGDVQE
ncbi:MAG TPA: YceI family protein [Candidatus Limnocylindria bacterium]|nr:YceI family protein [Candidatus Limnocylindria bacterium]